MAFTQSTFYQIGPGGNGPRLWIYNTPDAIATVVAADYFLPKINEIGLNDCIIVVSSTGGTPAVTLSYCNENDGTTIDMVDGLLIPATDT